MPAPIQDVPGWLFTNKLLSNMILFFAFPNLNSRFEDDVEDTSPLTPLVSDGQSIHRSCCPGGLSSSSVDLRLLD